MCQVNGGVAVMYQSDNGDVMFGARCLSQAAPLAFSLVFQAVSVCLIPS